ncbi:hypothetical protein TWF730_003326 [Orbilia blumenaviensis]|uniref:Uncharacterized protein n=1 Tax=Orbilia blumenaviensis TaxID=1796055 RepID=A0AAV9U7C7_9PEZI
MDSFIKNLGGGSSEGERRTEGERKDEGGFLGKAQGFLNEQAGGGQKGEQKEDGLDKAVDYVQEKFLGQGPQDNESAAEQAKDEAISDFIRDQYKKQSGKDFPISDK